MLCYLTEIELRPREGKTPMLLCKWVGVDGDAKAEKFITDPKTGKKRVNLNAVKARQIVLNKNIFPLTKEDAAEWVKGADYQIFRKPDADGVLGEKKFDVKLDDCTCMNLLYKQVPLSELDCEYKAISYYTNANVLKTQTYVTVIGFADENDVWAESLTPQEMAQNNLNTNLANGTYFEAVDEEDGEDKPLKLEEKEVDKKVDKTVATEQKKKDVDFDFQGVKGSVKWLNTSHTL